MNDRALQHPTGDTAGTLEALRTDLSHIKYPHGLNSVRALAGDPAELLPVLSFTLLRFSRHVALLCQDYQLHGRTDQRFVEAAWKFARDALGLPKLALTPSQFLSEGFAERKLLLLRQVIKACKDHHNAAARKERLAALKGAAHSEQRLYTPPHAQQAGKSGGSARPAPAKVVNAFALPAADTPTAAACSPSADVGLQQQQQQALLPEKHADCTPSKHGEDPPAGVTQVCEAAAAEPNCQMPCAASPEPEAEAEQPRPLPGPLLAQQAAEQAARVAQIPRSPIQYDTGQAPHALPSSAWPGGGLHCKPPAALPAVQFWQGNGAGSSQPVTQGLLGAAAEGSLWGVQLRQVHTQPAMQASRLVLPQASCAPVGASAAELPAVPSGSGAAAAAPGRQQHIGPMPPHPPASASQQPIFNLAAWEGRQPAEAPASLELGFAQQAGAAAWPAPQLGVGDAATRRAIEELQLRLQLAEEAALGARRAAEQVQDGLLARIAVLEGRVKFLESGFGLQPLVAQPLPLPWTSTSNTPGHPQQQHKQPQGSAAASTIAVAAHWGPPAGSSTGGLGLPPQPQQQELAWAAPRGGAPMRLPQLLQRAPAGCSTASSIAAPGSAIPAATQGPGTSPTSSLVAVGSTQNVALQRSISSTAELISSMQSRFSEADEFLRSLQRH